MNVVAKSSLRDRRILKYLDVLGALTTEQVRFLCFRELKTGERKAQQRLKKLYDLGLVKRLRPSLDSPLVHWTEERPSQLEHVLARNWVYCYLVGKCASWEKVESWNVEEDYGVLRCDALARIKNYATGKNRFLFVEVDLSENRFDKVQKYTLLCREGIDSWWADEAEAFPPVLLVTESSSRLEQIRKCVRQENPLGIRFEVKLLSELRRVVSEWKVNP